MDTSYIQIMDTKTFALTNIDIPIYGKLKGFVEGIFNKDGSEYWFTQMNENGRVFVMSMSNFSIIANIPTYASWTKVGEFTPDFKYYYVSNWLSHDITIINAKTYSYAGKFKTYGAAPRGVGFSNDGKFVYVVMFDSGEIIKYSINENYKVVSRVKTGGANGRFRIDRAKEVAYINNMGVYRLFIYDMKTDKIIKSLKMWDHPDNVKLSPDNRYLYVSNRGPNNKNGYMLRSPVDGRIMIFDTERNYEKIEELSVGNQPIGLAISPDGKILAISNFMDNTIEFYGINL
jgi:DNA-binding beta-propeller fold protein YncE